jgi:hypothetical protein
LGQASHFIYLGSDVTYTSDNYLRNRLGKYDRICDTTGRNLKTKKEIRLKSCRVVERHTLLYGNESWAVKAGYINKIQPVKMRCLTVKGCILKINVLKKLKMKSLQNRTNKSTTE